LFSELFALCGSHYTDFWKLHKYALFCNLWYFSGFLIFLARAALALWCILSYNAYGM
jgi:hypothetical protein